MAWYIRIAHIDTQHTNKNIRYYRMFMLACCAYIFNHVNVMLINTWTNTKQQSATDG